VDDIYLNGSEDVKRAGHAMQDPAFTLRLARYMARLYGGQPLREPLREPRTLKAEVFGLSLTQLHQRWACMAAKKPSDNLSLKSR
jgi:hypothetical protein